MEKTLLYLHIPFCDSKCHYCSFNSYVDRFELKERYMRAVTGQLRSDLETFGIEKGSLASLFIGGGTPSTVEPHLYEPFFEALGEYLCEGAEITSEANPNSATKGWLEGMKGLGVNRISFGVQSLFDDKLRLLGRAHRAAEARRAVEEASHIGFDHLSIDLIYATILDTPQRIEEELERALRLPVDHLSAYELTIEEGTLFQKSPEVRVESLEQAHTLRNRLEERGWEGYEVSNFGRSKCRHNLGYWEYRPYLGIGSGAVGRIGNLRYAPHRQPERYIDDPLFKEEEPLTPQQIREEKILLGLRSCVGISSADLTPPMRERAELLVREGRLTASGGRCYNPDYLLSDEIALFIIG
ncbi:radical SAM family heme chaperone HemW [Hydrogenimonas sp.]